MSNIGLEQNNLVDTFLPMDKNVMLAIQHLFVGVIAAIPVPLIVGGAANLSAEDVGFLISATLFMAGIATILQCFGFTKFVGAKVPNVMGCSFSVVAACVTVVSKYPDDPYMGFRIIAGATIVAGIVCILIAPVWSKLLRFFPLVVVGTVVTCIGIALLPVAINWITNQGTTAGTSEISMALFVFLIVVLLNKFLKGIWASLAVLFALIIGTAVASIIGMADFSAVSSAAAIGFNTPFHFGMPVFNIPAIVTFIIIMLLTMNEVTGSLLGIHQIVDKKIDNKTLTNGLRATGIGALLAGGFNSVIPTIFAPSVGLIELTKQKSRYITATAGLFLVIISFFPKISAIIYSVPGPVLGGAGFAMFGMVAASGIKILSGVDYNGNNNLLIVALSIGLCMIPTVMPTFFAACPELIQTIFGGGITIGSIAAILLNIIFNEIKVNRLQN